MQPLELSHLQATVKWYEKHPCSHFLGPSVIVTSTTFSPFSCASFLLLSTISTRCAYVQTTFNFSLGNDVVVVCVPLHSKS